MLGKQSLAALQAAVRDKEYMRTTADGLDRAVRAAEEAGAARTAPRWLSNEKLRAGLCRLEARRAREHLENDHGPTLIREALKLPFPLRRSAMPWRITKEVQEWLARHGAWGFLDHTTNFRIVGRRGRPTRHEMFTLTQPYMTALAFNGIVARVNADPDADFFACPLPQSYAWHSPGDGNQQVAAIYPRQILA